MLTAVLTILPALAVGLRGTLPLGRAAPLDWVAYSWLGIAFYLFVTLLALEPVRLVVSRVLLREDDGVIAIRRRLFLARGLATPEVTVVELRAARS